MLDFLSKSRNDTSLSTRGEGKYYLWFGPSDGKTTMFRELTYDLTLDEIESVLNKRKTEVLNYLTDYKKQYKETILADLENI